MTTTIPKPVFVIADVHSGSYTTAMEVTTAGQITSASISTSSSSSTDVDKITKDDNDDDEPVLLCGTNDGSLSLWSLRTYRCLHRFSPEELATLLELSQPIQPGDPVRITSLHARAGRLLLQLKSNELFLLDFRSSLRHPVSLLSERPWTTFSTTFAQFFPLFEHCYAFLAEEKPPSRSGASKGADVIQLVNSKRCLPFCRVKLVSKAEKDEEEEKGHGIVMALHLFIKDIASSGAEDDEPARQALYLLLAYEDGFIELYRATFKEHLQTLFEKASATRQKSLSAQQQPVFEAVQTSGLQSHAEMVTCIAFHEGTSRGVACSVDNEIAIWEVRTAEDSSWRRRRLGEGEEGGDEKKDKQLGLVERRSRRIRLTNAGILCAAIRPDGRIFATGGKDGRLRLFGLRTGKPLAVLAYHANTIEAVRFGGSLSSSNHNSKGSLLFAASRDKSISVWSLYNDD